MSRAVFVRRYIPTTASSTHYLDNTRCYFRSAFAPIRRPPKAWEPPERATASGENSDLVTAFADVPRLGNQFHLRQDGVLMNDLEERMQLVHPFIVPRQGGREIKPKAIDVHVVHPIAEAVHHKLQGPRMK